MARGQFTDRVKEELAALRPGAPSERRALLAGLLRFAATLHLAGTVGPRVTLVLATESGGVARLAFWLLHAAYGVRPEFRMRTRGALVARVRYEVVLAERVERVFGGAGILDGSGQLATGVPARLVRGRAARSACPTSTAPATSPPCWRGWTCPPPPASAPGRTRRPGGWWSRVARRSAGRWPPSARATPTSPGRTAASAVRSAARRCAWPTPTRPTCAAASPRPWPRSPRWSGPSRCSAGSACPRTWPRSPPCASPTPTPPSPSSAPRSTRPAPRARCSPACAVSRPWPAPPRTRRWPAGRRRAGDRHPGRIRADQGRIAHRFPGRRVLAAASGCGEEWPGLPVGRVRTGHRA